MTNEIDQAIKIIETAASYAEIGDIQEEIDILITALRAYQEREKDTITIKREDVPKFLKETLEVNKDIPIQAWTSYALEDILKAAALLVEGE